MREEVTHRMSLRDEVWNASIKQLVKKPHFKISELPFDEGQQHTVRRVLRRMEELGWLTRRNDRSATWCAGETAQLHLNISAEKLRAMQEHLEPTTQDTTAEA